MVMEELESGRKQSACKVFTVSVLLSMCLMSPQTGYGQQTTPIPPTGQTSIFGGQGWAWFSQFSNPSFLGAVYMTPDWPKTGYYPLYPGGFAQPIHDRGFSVGPMRLHPMMGVAEIYTDNVFRTNTNRKSDYATTLAPGLQAEVPFGSNHMFIADYRTNLQFFHRNPTNNVQDQTASGRFSFALPSRVSLDLQGEYKIGHDPRGTALDNLNLELNKWRAATALGQIAYDGANAGVQLNLSSTKWNYLDSLLGVFRDRVANNAGLTLKAKLTGKTSLISNFAVTQQSYDQASMLDNNMYTASGGLRWDATQLTYGELLGGYQLLKFTNSIRDQTIGGIRFLRTGDSYGTFYFAGNAGWQATPLLLLKLQGFRSFQQTVVFDTLFFTATGVNFSAIHDLTNSTALTMNLGYENDRFESPAGSSTPNREDTLKNAAIGIRYRAVKWLAGSIQYIFEDRKSNQQQFAYHANSVMASLQVTF
jgi:hypothetical protein